MKLQEEACLFCRSCQLPSAREASSSLEKWLWDLCPLWSAHNTLCWWATWEQVLPPCQRLWSKHSSYSRFIILWLCSCDYCKPLWSSICWHTKLEELLYCRGHFRCPSTEENSERDQLERIFIVTKQRVRGAKTFPMAYFPQWLRCFLHGYVWIVASTKFY